MKKIFLVISLAWACVLDTHLEQLVCIQVMRWTKDHHFGWPPEQQQVPATREETDQGRGNLPSIDDCNYRPQPDSAMQTNPFKEIYMA